MAKAGVTRQAVYDYIRSYISTHAFPPTVREICTALNLKSTSTAHMHLQKLEDEGKIKRNPSMQRSIKLCEPKPDLCRNLPLVGAVAAGSPILAVDNIQEYISLPAGLLHGADEEEAFLLQVNGESMILAGINHGDLLVVHRGLKAENGDIVVARVGEDSATVKRIFFEQDAIRLQPENPYMEPIYAGYQDVAIVGKVIALLRRY